MRAVSHNERMAERLSTGLQNRMDAGSIPAALSERKFRGQCTGAMVERSTTPGCLPGSAGSTPASSAASAADSDTCARGRQLRCGSCGQTKPANEFHRHRSGYRDRCKECSRVYHHTHYLKNRSRYICLNAARSKRYKDDIRALLAELKAVPCADCGKTYPPYVMDFDHVRGKKLFAVTDGYGKRKFPLRKILAEIKKCDVVCANCHRIRTHSRFCAGVTAAGPSSGGRLLSLRLKRVV